jgi:hypothetical protein
MRSMAHSMPAQHAKWELEHLGREPEEEEDERWTTRPGRSRPGGDVCAKGSGKRTTDHPSGMSDELSDDGCEQRPVAAPRHARIRLSRNGSGQITGPSEILDTEVLALRPRRTALTCPIVPDQGDRHGDLRSSTA